MDSMGTSYIESSCTVHKQKASFRCEPSCGFSTWKVTLLAFVIFLGIRIDLVDLSHLG